MGFLELTLVNSRTTFDIKDVSHTMFGKLSINVSSLVEGHPIHGCYPIFANGHQLIGSITLGITITFYNHKFGKECQDSINKSNKCQMNAKNKNAKSYILSSSEKIKEVASTNKIPPFYSCIASCDTYDQPLQGEINLYSLSNSNQSFKLPKCNQKKELVEDSMEEKISSKLDQSEQKIDKERLACSQSNLLLNLEQKMIIPIKKSISPSCLQQDNEINENHLCNANTFSKPLSCQSDDLKVNRKANIQCASDGSSMSSIVSKYDCLMQAPTTQSRQQDYNVESTKSICSKKTILQESKQFKNRTTKGSYNNVNYSMFKNDYDSNLEKTKKNNYKG